MKRSRTIVSAVLTLAVLALLAQATPGVASGGSAPVLAWSIVSTTGTGAAQYVSVADDGSAIAYCAGDAYVVGVSGGVPGGAAKASLDASGGPIDGVAEQTALSGDGSVVAYASTATDIVPLDLNGEVDIFARDLAAGANSIVSIAGASTQGDFGSTFPNLDETGAHVAFQSYADNLSGSDNDGVINLYVRDRAAGTTTLVNGYRNGSSYGLDLTDSGTSGVFMSGATDFGVTDTNGQIDVVRWNGGSSYTVVSTVGGGAATGNGYCTAAAISGDGSVIAFSSSSSNISTGDLNGKSDVFVWSGGSGATRVDNGPAGAQLSGDSTLVGLSENGRFVLYYTTAANAASGPGLYVRDLLEGAEPVFVASTSSTDAEIGGSGEFVALSTTADLAGDGDALADVYVTFHDFASPSVSADVEALYDAGGGPTISATDNLPGVTAYWRYGTDATQSASPPVVATAPDAAGSHTLTYWAVDAAGNESRPRQASVVVGDTRAPESTAGSVPASFDGTASITITAIDPAIGTGSSGVAGIEWWTDPEGYGGGVAAGSSAVAEVARAGDRTLYWRAWDAAGNYEATQSASFTVHDVTAPSVEVWELAEYNDRAQVSVFVDDGFNGVGPASLQYKVDAGAAQPGTLSVDAGSSWGTGLLDVSGLGTHTIEVRACDGAGNWSGWVSAQFDVVDETEPSVTMTPKGKGPAESTLVHLVGTDNGYSPAGVTSVEWQIAAGDVQSASGAEATITVPGYPGQTLQYWSVDGAGNRSPGNSDWIAIADGRAPSVSVSVDWEATPIRAYFSATDPVPGSGVERIRWSKNGLAPGQVMGASAFEEFSDPGTNTVEVWAYDADGNESAHETTQIVVPGDDGGGGGDGGDGPLEVRSVTANAGALWSRSTTLAVDIDASGATEMRLAFSYGALAEATWAPYSSAATLTAPGPGEWPVWVQVRNAEGVTAEKCAGDPQVRVDLVAPVTTSNADETGHGWRVGDEITFASDDPATVAFSASGVAATHYRIDGGEAITGTGYVLPASGTRGIEWWAEDIAGNVEEAHEATIAVVAAPATLSLGLSATTVTYPGRTTVRAVLADSESGEGIEGRSVSAQWSSSGSTGWSTVQTLSTGAGGVASWSTAPSRTGYYRLVFAGDETHEARTTGARKVTVKPYLSTPTTSVSRVAKRKRFKITGYVRPKHTSGVAFRCYRYESGTWRLRKTVSVKYSSHDAQTSKVYQYTSLPSRGTWRIKTYHSDSSHSSPLYSGYRKVVVK